MNKKGFGMIELLITVVIVGLLGWFVAKNYMGGNPGQIDDKTKVELSKEGVKTDTMQDMVESAQKQAEEANKKNEEYQKQLEGQSPY